MAFLFLANSTGKAVSFDTPEPFGPRKRVQFSPGAGDGRINSASCSNQICRTRHFMCGQYSNHATRTALPLARTPSVLSSAEGLKKFVDIAPSAYTSSKPACVYSSGVHPWQVGYRRLGWPAQW